MKSPLLIALLAGTLLSPAIADEPDQIDVPFAQQPADPHGNRPARLTVFVENDGRSLKPIDNTDRYYTSGVKVDMAFQPEWARPFAESIPLGADFTPERTAFGVSVAHLIFTPWRISRPDPPEDDHPYAGYLHGSVYFQRAEAPWERGSTLISTFDHLQLDFGVVGPSTLAEEIQEEVHRFSGDPKPRGWSRQLKDEPTLNVTFRRKVRLEFAHDEPDLTFQLIPEVGFDVGTVWRQAVGGFTVRFGQNLPDDYGPARLLVPGSAVALPNEGFGWQVFARAEGRLVQHDLFLDGNTWTDSASTDRNPVVGELSLGTVLHFGRNVEVGYSQTIQSERFEEQDGPHGWGSIFFRAFWTF